MDLFHARRFSKPAGSDPSDLQLYIRDLLRSRGFTVSSVDVTPCHDGGWLFTDNSGWVAGAQNWQPGRPADQQVARNSNLTQEMKNTVYFGKLWLAVSTYFSNTADHFVSVNCDAMIRTYLELL